MGFNLNIFIQSIYKTEHDEKVEQYCYRSGIFSCILTHRQLFSVYIHGRTGVYAFTTHGEAAIARLVIYLINMDNRISGSIQII